MEVRELLDLYQFPGDDTPVIASALKAGRDESEIGTQSIEKLVLWMNLYQYLTALFNHFYAYRRCIFHFWWTV